MIIHCPKCKTGYNVPADKLGEEGRVVRCTNCKHTWTAKVDAQPKAEEVTEEPAPIAPIAPSTEAGGKSIHDAVAKEISEQKQKSRRLVLGIMACLFIIGALIGLSQNIFFNGQSEDGTLEVRGHKILHIDGLEIPEMSIERTLTEGHPTTLTFTGKVVNKTGASLRVPKIIVSLHDESGLELDRWPAYTHSPTLSPGEETTWVCRFFDPQLSRISEHRVRFVEKENH